MHKNKQNKNKIAFSDLFKYWYSDNYAAEG